MPNANDTELLTVAEAASFLRLRPSTIRAWILCRKIPFVKLGGRVFLRRTDVEALIASSVVPARAGMLLPLAGKSEMRGHD